MNLKTFLLLVLISANVAIANGAEKYTWTALPFHDSYIDNTKTTGTKSDGFRVVTMTSYKEISSAQMWGLSEISEHRIDCNKTTIQDLKTTWTEKEMGKGRIVKIFSDAVPPASVKKILEGVFERDLYSFVCSAGSHPVAAVEKNEITEPDARNNIKYVEQAGACVGAATSAHKAGIQATSFSAKTQANLIDIKNKIVDKSKSSSLVDVCYKNGVSFKLFESCIDSKIPDKRDATFWKSFVSGLEFVASKNEASEKQLITDTLCANLK